MLKIWNGITFGEEHIMTCLGLETLSLGLDLILDGLDLRLDSDLPVLTSDLTWHLAWDLSVKTWDLLVTC